MINLKKRLILWLAGWLVAVTPIVAADLQVFAAASLKDVFIEAAVNYEKLHGDDKLHFNFAGSNILAQQIKEGAPADLFASADEAKMNDLEKVGLILKETRRSLLSNRLVMVVNRTSSVDIKKAADLTHAKVKRLALAETRSVPAGIYTREYLQKVGIWEQVKAKVIPTENVRAALAAVESGDADAAIIYLTDAAISKSVKIAWEVPIQEGPKISYPFAVTKESKHPQETKRLLQYLASEAGLRLFEKYGFIVQR